MTHSQVIMRVATAGAVVTGLLLAGPGAASAADPDPASSGATSSAPAPPATPEDEVSWSVGPQPASNDEPRPVFSYDVAPGDSIKDTLRIRVLGAKSITFDVYPADAFQTEEGSFDVLPAGRPSKDAGAWVRLAADEVEVGGNEVTLLPFTLKVPDNATPGDHTAGIVTSISQTVDAGDRGTVTIDRRLGARIYVRVAGELRPALAVSRPTVKFRGSGNPVGTSAAEVSYTVTNTGNTRLHARRTTGASGFIGGRKAGADLPELLPGSVFRVTEKVGGIRLAGRVTGSALVETRPAVQGELAAPDFDAAHSSSGRWTLPLAQSLLLLALVAGAVATAMAAARRRAEGLCDDTSDAVSPGLRVERHGAA